LGPKGPYRQRLPDFLDQQAHEGVAVHPRVQGWEVLQVEVEVAGAALADYLGARGGWVG
jgi:hypothetical protein